MRTISVLLGLIGFAFCSNAHSVNRTAQRFPILDASHDPPGNQDLVWSAFDETSARNFGAVCNDQSVGGVFVRHGGHSKRVLVFLEGGFMCWDLKSCMQRNESTPELMSSKSWDKTTKSLGGMFSDWSVLHNFTLVYVPYCSSDSWTGSSGDPTPDMPFVFRGHNIVKYLVEVHLKSILTDANVVLFGGCSAGGRGSLYNLDMFCKALPNNTTKCLGLHDAAWWLNTQPIVQAPSLWNSTKAGVQMWNATILQGECGAATTPDTVTNCFFGTESAKHITTPFIMHSQLYDSFQIGYNTNQSPPFSGSAVDYVESFGEMMDAELKTFGATYSKCSVFSTACYDHCITLSTEAYFEYTVKFGGLNFNDVVDLFLASVPLRAIDTCSEVNCSGGCKA